MITAAVLTYEAIQHLVFRISNANVYDVHVEPSALMHYMHMHYVISPSIQTLVH